MRLVGCAAERGRIVRILYVVKGELFGLIFIWGSALCIQFAWLFPKKDRWVVC